MFLLEACVSICFLIKLVYVKGTVCLVGGQESDLRLSPNVTCADDNWVWRAMPPINLPRVYSATVVINGRLLCVLGGVTDVECVVSGKVNWEVIPNWALPYRVDTFATIQSQGQPCVVGGRLRENTATERTLCFSTLSQTWTLGAALTSPRMGHASFRLGGVGLWCIGGGRRAAAPDLFANSLECFSELGGWKIIASALTPGIRNTYFISLPGRQLCLGGNSVLQCLDAAVVDSLLSTATDFFSAQTLLTTRPLTFSTYTSPVSTIRDAGAYSFTNAGLSCVGGKAGVSQLIECLVISGTDGRFTAISTPTVPPVGAAVFDPAVLQSQRPTPLPSLSPTVSPTTPRPTPQPTSTTPRPSASPSASPSAQPTAPPATSSSPTGQPSTSPTGRPSSSPTGTPSSSPTGRPTSTPISSPTSSPSRSPINSPTPSPTSSPISSPTPSPTSSPISSPTPSPTSSPISSPTPFPTGQLSTSPTSSPTGQPSSSPTGRPSSSPSRSPTGQPSSSPTGQPSSSPTGQPSSSPSASPTRQPSASPTIAPTAATVPTASPIPTASPTPAPSPTSVCVVSGATNDGDLVSTVECTTSRFQWQTRLRPLNYPRIAPIITTILSRRCVVGGLEVECWNTLTGGWEVVVSWSLPVRLSSPTLITLQGQPCLVGGNSSQVVQGTTLCFTPTSSTSGSWTPASFTLSQPRFGAVSFVIGSSRAVPCVAGGRNQMGVALSSVECLADDGAGLVWQLIAPTLGLPEPRPYAVNLDGLLCVGGVGQPWCVSAADVGRAVDGRGTNSLQTAMLPFAFRPLIAPLFTPREGASSFELGGSVCVLGGRNSLGAVSLLECYTRTTPAAISTSAGGYSSTAPIWRALPSSTPRFAAGVV